MKETSSNEKTSSSRTDDKAQRASAGADGIAIAPPAYGIESVDSLSAQAAPIQRMEGESAVGGDAGSPQPNRTGLPDALKSGVESLSGFSLDDVRVHYNSSKPAQLQALAYAQGTDIHVGPGQERHLPHEAWHIVQQKQGRVRPTLQMKSIQINDNENLETEATTMGARALRLNIGQKVDSTGTQVLMTSRGSTPVVQRALVIAPTIAADRNTMNTLPNAAPADMGNTGDPQNYTVPTYNINTVSTATGWVSSVGLTAAADEGVNFARYLGPGIHSTGLMSVHGALGPYVAGNNNREIYGEVSAAIADDNRDAEQEHVDDFLRAYAITLDVAEQAINAAVAASPFPARPTAPAADAAAETFMNNNITMQTNALNATPFQITANLGNLYDNACQQSMQRDANGWHTFRPDMTAESNSMAAWAHWTWYLGAHEIREIQHGPNFSVGVTTSANLIT